MFVKKARLFKLKKLKFKRYSLFDGKQRNFTLPNWLLNVRYWDFDIPKYIEVDYLTLSAFVIYEPFLITDIQVNTFLEENMGVYNMYNWKYIT